MRVLNSSLNSSLDLQLYHFTQGLDQDQRMSAQEIQVQKAWAATLQEGKILTPEEGQKLQALLDKALKLIQEKKFPWRIEDEDIHMNLERFLTEEGGDLGKKSHLGRSRNDLIATTLRLFVSDLSDHLTLLLGQLIEVLLELGERTLDTIVPGMTHWQHGQPIRMAQIWVAHARAFQRDISKFSFTKASAMETMPLGSAAFAGTTLTLNFARLAERLGFRSPPKNGHDAVGDRDFILEFLNSVSLCAVHLGRLSLDLIYWSSTPVGILSLSPQWSTGSSIMPNKRNPDIPELIRAKTGRLLSLSTEGAIIMKSTPSSYSSDLHELKKTLILGYEELQSCLSVMRPFLQGAGFRQERIKKSLQQGHILSTDVTDYLTTQKNLPFRTSYQKVAELIAMADSHGVQIHQLKEAEWSTVVPEMDESFINSLNFVSSVERRDGPGGTSRSQVQQGLMELKTYLHTLSQGVGQTP